MQVIFTEEFKNYTSGLSEITVEGKDVGSSLQEVFNRFPQLLVFLTANREAEALKTSIKLNGEYIFEPSDVYLTVTEEDCLEFGRDVPEGESSGTKMMAGIVLVAIGAATSWTGVGAFVGTLGVSLMLGGITEMIVGTPYVPGASAAGTTPTAFTGIQNTTAPGTPVGIVYGTHRVGGHLASVYTDVEFETFTYLYAQIALSEGEIEKVDKVEINKRDIDDLSYISAYWRKGTKDQEYQTPLHTNTDMSNPVTVAGIPVFPYTIANDSTFTSVKITIVPGGLYGDYSSVDYTVWLTSTDGTVRAEAQTQTTAVAPAPLTFVFSYDQPQNYGDIVVNAATAGVAIPTVDILAGGGN